MAWLVPRYWVVAWRDPDTGDVDARPFVVLCADDERETSRMLAHLLGRVFRDR